MILLTLEHVETELGVSGAAETYLRAKEATLDYCFPSRLEELLVLESMVSRYPENGTAYYLLGNLLYDRRRHEEAIAAWEMAARYNPLFATVWRNLGIAYFNIHGNQKKAMEVFDRALQTNPEDGRVLYERDQLWKRAGEMPERRLAELLRYPSLIQLRDDLSVELATLYNQTGRPEDALELMLHRRFQPWEGGEGLTLAQYVRARLLLGRRALDGGDAVAALAQFQSALEVPENLGEAKHLLANQSDIYYWLGVAHEKLGEQNRAEEWWNCATKQKGDFQQMSARVISETSYWSALAQQQLGEHEEAAALFRRIYDYSCELEATEPTIPYFATSLPTMLLFEEDLHGRNIIQARYLRAQALVGMGRADEAVQLLEEVLKLDLNHAGASDLLHQIRMACKEVTAN
jgi:tetratricopeptide (TPR) repeat protein